jgi:hypothetical protein
VSRAIGKRDTFVSVSQTGPALREGNLDVFTGRALELVKSVIGIAKEPAVDRVVVSVHLVRSATTKPKKAKGRS